MKDLVIRRIPRQEPFPEERLLAEIYTRHLMGQPAHDDDSRLGVDVMCHHFDRYDSFDKLRARLDWYCDEHEKMNAVEKTSFMTWLMARYRAEFGYEMFE